MYRGTPRIFWPIFHNTEQNKDRWHCPNCSFDTCVRRPPSAKLWEHHFDCLLLIAAFESILRTGNDLGWAWAAPFAPAPAIFALAIVGPIALATRLAVLGPFARPGAARAPEPLPA